MTTKKAKHKTLSEEIEAQALLQLRTGSADEYGQGLYNGLLMGAWFADKSKAYSPVTLAEYKKLRKIYK